MAGKVKFTVKEGPKRCFLMAEGHGVIVQLAPPADIEHARRVAAFLNEHVEDIECETGTLTVSGGSGRSTKIGGGWMSLFGDGRP